DMVLEYFPSGSKKIEIIFFANGEITIKKFLEDGTVDKEALLNEDGDFYIQKPQSDVIKSFRQRYWVDYNNPHWIENSDKYSITSIPRLTLDVAAYMLVELDIEVPDILKNIYSVY
ncbi:MAG: hypothetical protein IKW39_05455, partial [Alphaproteobacteria bacterium]|nr:hypothetical protein [Alphaproteobacteria bacterium]